MHRAELVCSSPCSTHSTGRQGVSRLQSLGCSRKAIPTSHHSQHQFHCHIEWDLLFTTHIVMHLIDRGHEMARTFLQKMKQRYYFRVGPCLFQRSSAPRHFYVDGEAGLNGEVVRCLRARVFSFSTRGCLASIARYRTSRCAAVFTMHRLRGRGRPLRQSCQFV
jgi:hypothetical protein